MLLPPRSTIGAVVGSLALIAAIVGAGAAAFAYTAGWLSPARLTPDKMVDAFRPATGEALGHRRNHAKGICYTGVFDANGAGAALSKAQVFAAVNIPFSGVSISARPIRTRRMRHPALGEWECGFRRRTGRNGAAP